MVGKVSGVVVVMVLAQILPVPAGNGEGDRREAVVERSRSAALPLRQSLRDCHLPMPLRATGRI